MRLTTFRSATIVVAIVVLAASAHAADPMASCQKGRLKMSGKYAACLAGADAAFAANPDATKRDAARAKCESKMQGLWTKKTTQYSDATCGGLWDDADVRSWLDSCNDSLVAGITTNFDVRPSLDCIDRNNDGSITATFGYDNRQAVPVIVPVGTNNGVSSGGLDAGQPTTFVPGVVADAFTIRFRGQATWNVGGRSVTADRHSPLCATQPATPTPCEADLRASFLSMEAANDISIASLRSGYDSALALARAGLAPLVPAGATGDATTASFPRSTASCGTLVDDAMTSASQALTIARQNNTIFQNQMISVLQSVAAGASSGTVGTLETRSAALTATVPGTPISADAFGDFEEWATSVTADYLNDAAQAHMEFAAGVLEVAATDGTILSGSAPGASAEAPSPAFPRSIVSDDIDASSTLLATGALQALNVSAQNAVMSHQQECSVLLSALTDTANAVLGGKAIYRGTLDQARDPDRFLLLDPEVTDLTIPTVTAVDPAVAASADAFYQLAQANNRGFHSSLSVLADTQTTYGARILSLVQSSAAPPSSAQVPVGVLLRAAGTPRVVDPSADPGDVALANAIAAFAQGTVIQMQNEAAAQQSQFTANRAELSQQIGDWLAMP